MIKILVHTPIVLNPDFQCNGKLYGGEFDTRKYDSREYFRTQRNSNTNLQALLNSLSIENLNIYIINRQKIIEILQPDAQILP